MDENLFDPQQVVFWVSEDFNITESGEVSGTLTTYYDGPTPPRPLVGDFLFIGIFGKYNDMNPNTGDFYSKILSDVIPLEAEQSENRSAKFVLDASFRVPDVSGADEGLVEIQIPLTWVRAYKGGEKLYFSIFPGRIPARTRFGQSDLIGRFDYYDLIAGKNIDEKFFQDPHVPRFNYPEWIRQRLEAGASGS